MQIKRVRKQSLFTFFVCSLLAISVLFVGTYAAFTAQRTATGTITFDANVWVTVRGGGTAVGNGSTTLSYNLSPVYEQAGTGNFYGNLSGGYGVCNFDTSNSTTPNIYYDVYGDIDAFVGFQIELKFTPNGTTGYTYSDFGAGGTTDLTKVDNWNIYPSFNGFTANEIQYGASGADGSDYSFYKAKLNSNTDYGVLCSAPVVGGNGSSYYTKTYSMFIMADVGGYLEDVRVPSSGASYSAGVTFALSDIVNGFKYAFDIDGTEVNLLTGGTIDVTITCKAGIFTFTDF